MKAAKSFSVMRPRVGWMPARSHCGGLRPRKKPSASPRRLQKAASAARASFVSYWRSAAQRSGSAARSFGSSIAMMVWKRVMNASSVSRT